MISAGLGHMFKTIEMAVGDSYRFPFFDPSTMAQREVLLRVVGKESLVINKIEYNAFRLETEMWGRVMTFWVDEQGSILREEGFMGLTLVKSSSANAPMNIEGGGGEDFYEITSVPVDKNIPDPLKLASLKLKVIGISDTDIENGVWNGVRQAYSAGIMEIKKEKIPERGSYLIPYNSDDKMASFLRPEFNIESDAQEIVERARKIAYKDQDPLSIAGKMMKWVYDSLDKRPVVSVPSALEVLRTRVGDCNEHATLLTALLRAVRIPARLSIGVVYTRNKFFYHAWTEAYVGEWITLDATMNQMPVDVSHIRLVYGNLDKQVEILGLIGKLKFEVLDYEYD